MLPSVTWHTAVETKEDDTLPWMGAAQAHYFTDYYLVSHSYSQTRIQISKKLYIKPRLRSDLRAFSLGMGSGMMSLGYIA
jgi:hypothetical protein